MDTVKFSSTKNFKAFVVSRCSKIKIVVVGALNFTFLEIFTYTCIRVHMALLQKLDKETCSVTTSLLLQFKDYTVSKYSLGVLNTLPL